MNPALGPFAIAAGLLIGAGVLKAMKPHDTAVAVAKMGLPAPEWVVRIGAGAEVALGVAALVAASSLVAALVAASYALFFAFVAIALARRLPIASCGCFGRADSPPSLVHLGVNAAAAAAAVTVAVDPGPAPIDIVHQPVAEAGAFLALVLVGITAVGLAVTTLPRLLVLARQDGGA